MTEPTKAASSPGPLAQLMSTRLLSTPAQRARFLLKVEGPQPGFLDTFERRYGWRPSAELAEWAGVDAAYRAFSRHIPDDWRLARITVPELLDLESRINRDDCVLLLTTGLLRFGTDPCGDSCFLDTLPTTTGLVSVHHYDHESAELDGDDHASIADFIVSGWRCEDEDETARPPRRSRVSRAAHRRFERMEWLGSLTSGEPGYALAEKLSRAASFKTWLQEKDRIKNEPALANYWLLAHFFLGNDDAGRECIDLATAAPGEVTPALAAMLAGLWGRTPGARLGKLRVEALDEVRAAVQKNADPRLLEPRQRRAVAMARPLVGKRAAPKTLAARLGAGADPWALIAEFPDDVAGHDFILRALGSRPEWASLCSQYREARAERRPWPVWPEPGQKPVPDSRWSIVVGAAFRAGLAFDAEHRKAAPSLANTLAFFDDDVAMQSFRAAVETLPQGDPRLEYVVKALGASTHAGAADVVTRAAWRILEQVEAARKAQKKSAARGQTLDSLFRVDTFLRRALSWALRKCDDVAVSMADTMLSIPDGAEVFGGALADALRVVGERSLVQYLPFVRASLEALDARGVALGDTDHLVLAEASLALARLVPETAEAELEAIARRERSSHAHWLDMQGGTLAGLLFLSPKDPMRLAMAERILGNRTRQARVHGPLRALAAARISAGKDWARPHLYDRSIEPFWPVTEAASAALVANGEPPPPVFDDDDRYASRVPAGALLDALHRPDRHCLQFVFSRLRDLEVRSARLFASARDLLLDGYRFSADEDSSFSPPGDREAAFSTLTWWGPEALPVFAELLALPQAAGRHKTHALFAMNLVTDPISLWRRLSTASREEVFSMLSQRSPDTLGLSHLVAAWALARFGASAREPVEALLEWRVQLLSKREEESDSDAKKEQLLTRVVQLLSRYPEAGPFLGRARARIVNGDAAAAWDTARRASVTAPRGMGKRSYVILGSEAHDLLVTWRVGVEASSVELAAAFAGSATRQVVKHEQEGCKYEGVLACDSSEKAHDLAETIVLSLEALGFSPPVEERPQPRKRSKARSDVEPL
jgi:hypothetical protein